MLTLIRYLRQDGDMRTRHVQSDFPLLSIPNVRVLIRTEPKLVVLGKRGQQPGYRALLGPPSVANTVESIRERLAKRDWRNLSKEFFNLDLEKALAVCKWLGSAGYVPEVLLAEPSGIYFVAEDIQRISTEDLGWTPDYVTPEIRHWLKGYRDVFGWLMSREIRQFRDGVRMAKECLENEIETNQTISQTVFREAKTPRLTDPVATFMREIQAPPHFDPRILALALRGTGISELLRAEFLWDYDGKPRVIAHADSPIDAICVSIHIDRNFSRRNWRQCAQCGKWLDQIRGRDRFCSKKCRNYLNTAQRREKIKTLAAAEQVWRSLPAQQRKGHDHWRWIEEWARRKSKGKCVVEPSWAKQELTKMKMWNPTRDGRKGLQGGKNARKAQ
jgi:predicted nucleic acid-binding Zn ribbon protein